MSQTSKEGFKEAESAALELQKLTVELIGYLSTNGSPGQNRLLKSFAKRLAQTDMIVTFNWDTILDRVLSKQGKHRWHPSWGYGKIVRTEFKYFAHKTEPVPKKYPRLLKLHGSINWTAYKDSDETKRVIAKGWHSGKRSDDVVMMPPKMIKPEISGRQNPAELSAGSGGNAAISKDFYPRLWSEAERQLSRCRRLVFVGYSFPPADFAVSNMLRRAISTMKVSDNRFPAVDIVDPHAAELALRFEQSFKMKVPPDNQYLSLKNYLSSKRAK